MKHAGSSLPPVVEKALHSTRVRQMPSGQIILYEGDSPQEIFILKSGVVKLYDIDEEGNEKVLHLVKAPAVLPFAFFSGLDEPLRWFYTTLTDCELYILSAAELQRMTLEDSLLAKALTNDFSHDVHELLVRLSSLSKTNARDKVIAALKFLVTRHASERRTSWWRVNFPVSHQLIADLCGLTRETAAITMKELQNEKIVRNPRITILEINRKKLIDE